MKLKLPILGLLMTIAVGTLAACGSDPTSTPLPSATPSPTAVPEINQVSFNAVDFGFDGPDSIPAGMTRMTLVNEGKELHHLQLITVPEGMTADDLIAGLLSGGEGPPPPGVMAAGGVGSVDTTISASVTLNLAQGNYLMVCFIPNAEGVPHMALGMVKPLTVTEATGPLADAPDPDITIDLADFTFEFSTDLSITAQKGADAFAPTTFAVNNKGPQDHEALLVKLAPGATAADFAAAFAPGAPPGPPPGQGVGGFQAIAAGGGGSFTKAFSAGNYAFICFVEDPASGVPHFALGMVKEFTVQ